MGSAESPVVFSCTRRTPNRNATLATDAGGLPATTRASGAGSPGEDDYRAGSGSTNSDYVARSDSLKGQSGTDTLKLVLQGI